MATKRTEPSKPRLGEYSRKWWFIDTDGTIHAFKSEDLANRAHRQAVLESDIAKQEKNR